MPTRPEDRVRQHIDRMLEDSDWIVQDRSHFNLSAGRGVAICELAVKTGATDYALFVDEMPVGTVEAKKEGETLIGVEEQSMKYRLGLAEEFPDARYPLPFSAELTLTMRACLEGIEQQLGEQERGQVIESANR